MKKEIPNDKKYIFPEHISIVHHKGKILIISIETAKWIVLNNESQLKFFHLLSEHPLNIALSLFQGEYEDAQAVVIQLEARHFEDQKVHSCIDYERQTLQMYLTNACNLHCPHCYMYAGTKSANELKSEEIFKILSDFHSLGGNNVTFTGGEVTMRKDLTDIVKEAHKIGLKVRILTNGTCWSDDLINQVSPYISSIQISIDGFSEETNARVRGKGYYSISLQTLDKFIQNEVPSEVSITPYYDEDFDSYVDSYANFAQTLTDKYIGKNFKIKFAEQILEGREVSLDADQQKHYYNVINRIHERYYGTNTEEMSFIRAFRESQIMDNCMYGMISISSTGDVFFCARIPSVSSIGNVRETNFTEIMRLSKIAQFQSNINNLSPCKDCDLKYICGGGCRIDYFPTLTTFSDINSIDLSKIEREYCSIEEKNRFYDLMIKTNEKLFL